MSISTWPPSPDLLPRPRRHRQPRPAAPVIRWRPSQAPARCQPEDEPLGQWASEVALGPQV